MNDATPQYMVQGKRASSLEYRIAVSLTKLQIPFRFQVPYRGGTLLPGGSVLDFVVNVPFERVVEAMGEYWHTQGRGPDEFLREQLILMTYHYPVIYIWGNEARTQEECDQTVRSKVKQ